MRAFPRHQSAATIARRPPPRPKAAAAAPPSASLPSSETSETSETTPTPTFIHDPRPLGFTDLALLFATLTWRALKLLLWCFVVVLPTLVHVDRLWAAADTGALLCRALPRYVPGYLRALPPLPAATVAATACSMLYIHSCTRTAGYASVAAYVRDRHDAGGSNSSLAGLASFRRFVLRRLRVTAVGCLWFVFHVAVLLTLSGSLAFVGPALQIDMCPAHTTVGPGGMCNAPLAAAAAEAVGSVEAAEAAAEAGPKIRTLAAASSASSASSAAAGAGRGGEDPNQWSASTQGPLGDVFARTPLGAAIVTAANGRSRGGAGREAGREAAILALLAAGADPNQAAETCGPRGAVHSASPLALAIRGGRARTVVVLLDAGADVNGLGATKGPGGAGGLGGALVLTRSPMDLAVAADDVGIVDLLRARGGRKGGRRAAAAAGVTAGGMAGDGGAGGRRGSHGKPHCHAGAHGRLYTVLAVHVVFYKLYALLIQSRR